MDNRSQHSRGAAAAADAEVIKKPQAPEAVVEGAAEEELIQRPDGAATEGGEDNMDDPESFRAKEARHHENLRRNPNFRFMERHQHAMDTTTTGTNTALVGDPWRWPVVVLFSMFSSSSAIQWITYSTIATPARQYFNLSTNQLNMLSSIYMIIFVVGAYFACSFVERFGVRLSVLLGCSSNTLGALLKFAPGLQKPGYGIVMVAQVFNSCGQLFILEVPPLIAAQYFPPRKRAFATAIMSTSNNLGSALALIVPPFIVNKPDQHQFYILFGIELAYCGAILLGSIFFLRSPKSQKKIKKHKKTGKKEGETDAAAAAQGADGDEEDDVEDEVLQRRVTDKLGWNAEEKKNKNKKTAEPIHDDLDGAANANSNAPLGNDDEEEEEDGVGSAAQAADGGEPKSKMKRAWSRARQNKNVAAYLHVARTIIQLLSQRDFIFLLCAFSICTGSVWTYASVVGQILDPFGLSAELAGIAGALNLVAGTVAAYIVGLFVGYKRVYKIPVIVCLVGSVLFCLALIVIMKTAPPYTSLMSGLCVFIYIFAGVFQNTAMPIAFEFAMEMTYPLPESVPSALFMVGANVVSLILLSVSSAMLGNEPTPESCVYVIVLITCVCAVGAVLSLFPRERLYRHEAESYAREMRLKEELLSLTADTNTAKHKDNENDDLSGLLSEEREERGRGASEALSESALKRKMTRLSGKA